MLPEKEEYAPPLIIRVLNKQPFGQYPIVGVCVIKSLAKYTLSEEERRLLPPLDVLDKGMKF